LESPPPDCNKSHMEEGAPRKRKWEFAPRIEVGYDSSSDEESASSTEVYLRAIHKQIEHNGMLQRRIENSTKVLRNAERLVMGDPEPGPFRPPELPLLVNGNKVIEFPNPLPRTYPTYGRTWFLPQ
jgi:hypothetical protein